jgi:hypothetical protein
MCADNRNQQHSTGKEVVNKKQDKTQHEDATTSSQRGARTGTRIDPLANKADKKWVDELATFSRPRSPHWRNNDPVENGSVHHPDYN